MELKNFILPGEYCPPPEFLFPIIFPMMPIKNGFSYGFHIEWCYENNIPCWVMPFGIQNELDLPFAHIVIFFKNEIDAMAFKLIWC